MKTPKIKLKIPRNFTQIEKIISNSNLPCLKMTFLLILLKLMMILLWVSRPTLENSSIYVQDTRLMVRVETPGKYQEEKNTLKFNHDLGVFDESRSYKSHMFSIVGDSWTILSSSRSLCLGAQTSVERLPEVVEMVKGWSGPMSIAVFVPGIDLAIGLSYIQYLRQGCLFFKLVIFFP